MDIFARCQDANISVVLCLLLIEYVDNFFRTFAYFAPFAKVVELKGIEDWRLGIGRISLDHAFDSFAKNSECHLDLSQWNKECAQCPRIEGFATNTFFLIIEPIWEECKKVEGESQ